MLAKERQSTLFDPSDAADSRCPRSQDLIAWAHQGLHTLAPRNAFHIETCLKCAFDFSVWRTARCLSNSNPDWLVNFGSVLREWQATDDFDSRQMLGKIGFETQEASLSNEDDWTPSPFAVRVNLVMDEELQFFKLTILDAPAAFESVGLMTSHGMRHFTQTNDNAFELTIIEGISEEEELSSFTFTDIHAQVVANKLQLVIGINGSCNSATDIGDAVEILDQYHAIEREADYLLPCGLHCDTYVNSAALCAHEEAMQLISAKVDFLFWDKHFDTILTNGWAMSLIASRLADARYTEGRKEPIRQIQSEGYDDPLLLNDIFPGSQVLLVLDVVVTGALAKKLIRLVKSNGADVVGVAVIAKPHSVNLNIEELRSLCEIEVALSSVSLDDASRVTPLPHLVFNPIAGYMTTKATEARSPSEFLNQDRNARELWDYVCKADAYEHHRREGDTHYIGFVDTQKLLENREVGAAMVAKLETSIRTSGVVPDVLLIPQRLRAHLLAVRLSIRLGAICGTRPRIVTATKNRHTLKWALADDKARHLVNKRVCVVDTAAGHGRTIDQLSLLAVQHQASSVGAAVLLSRLTPPCETAFQKRLSAGFHRLYSLPIRPIAIRGKRLDLCPICRRKIAIKRFAEEADIEGLEQWALRLLNVRRCTPEKPRRRDRQLSLFVDDSPFLSSCGSRVASGVTLHALGAACTNGSAPLILPELSDDRIPWRVRATMVENLPAGILNWTGATLLSDLTNVLSENDYPSIWKATANLLSREGNTSWLDHLGTLLRRLEEGEHRTSANFWNHMACNAYLLVAASDHDRQGFHVRIDELLSEKFDSIAENGLRLMKEVVCE